MALFIRQDEQRSKLQERITAELNEKSRLKAEMEKKSRPDGVEDSRYLRESQMMSTRAWIWVLVILAVIIGSVAWASMQA